jgi:uncharacterized membrane protein YgcG
VYWCAVSGPSVDATALHATKGGLTAAPRVLAPGLRLAHLPPPPARGPPQELVATKVELAQLKEQQLVVQRQLRQASIGRSGSGAGLPGGRSTPGGGASGGGGGGGGSGGALAAE